VELHPVHYLTTKQDEVKICIY